jgi:hypothetical protein
MTTINKEKVTELKPDIESTINGINLISVLRDRIEKLMTQNIDPLKVKSILDNKEPIDILTDDELLEFFRVIFNQIKDDKFNPANYIEAPKKTRQKYDKNKPKDYKATKNEDVYNAKFKDQFLKNHRDVNGKPYADETKRVAIVLFGKVGKIESYYEKDIYDFDPSQFEEVLVSLKASTLRSLQNSISTLENYIDYAIKEHKTKNSNVATLYNNKDRIVNFLDKKAEENMFFTKHEIDALAEYAENSQDGVILNLIFDGVSHKNKFLELRNIRIQDCDFDKMVINIPQLVDEDTGEVYQERQVPISANTKMMINRAMDYDEKYVSLKGNTSRKYKIAVSDYVLRGLRNNTQIKWENVSQRIVRISEVSGYEFLNATTIAYSGQVHYANELIKEGFTVDEAVNAMIKRFNLSDNITSFYYLKNRLEVANKVLAND